MQCKCSYATGEVGRSRQNNSLWPIATAGEVALVEGLQRVPVTSLWYVWTAPRLASLVSVCEWKRQIQVAGKRASSFRGVCRNSFRFRIGFQGMKPSEDIATATKTNFWRKMAAGCIVAAGVCLVMMLYVFGLNNKSATERDYIEYWSAGQLLDHGVNPYDVGAIFRLEKVTGLEKNSPKVSFSPPLILLLAWPLGSLGAKTGLILWNMISLVCLAASVGLLWLIHGRPDTRVHLIGFGFPPALACLMAGQLDLFFLLEFLLFLYFHKTRPWLAGASLVFFALKPHLFLICAVVLLLWSAVRKDFRVLGGFFVALAAGFAFSLFLDPHAWLQYRQMMDSTLVMDLYLPTVGVTMRFLLYRHARWIEFLPEIAGCIWAVWYYWTRRDRWDWLDHGLLLILVSVACTPYSWYPDQTVLLPAILLGLYRVGKSLPLLGLFVLIAGAGLVGVIAQIQLPSPFYVWTAPAWLIWYLLAIRNFKISSCKTKSANMQTDFQILTGTEVE